MEFNVKAVFFCAVNFTWIIVTLIMEMIENNGQQKVSRKLLEGM